jgi:hypothetical protein
VKPFRISHPASAEFAEAVRWYEQKRLGLGGEFFDAVTHAIDLIRTPPRDRVSRWPNSLVAAHTISLSVDLSCARRGRLHRRDCAQQPKTGLLAKPAVTIQSG